MPDCPKCGKRKEEYERGSVTFCERSSARLELDPRIFDDIDKEAFVQLQQQNLTFPVEVDCDEG